MIVWVVFDHSRLNVEVFRTKMEAKSYAHNISFTLIGHDKDRPLRINSSIPGITSYTFMAKHGLVGLATVYRKELRKKAK